MSSGVSSIEVSARSGQPGHRWLRISATRNIPGHTHILPALRRAWRSLQGRRYSLMQSTAWHLRQRGDLILILHHRLYDSLHSRWVQWGAERFHGAGPCGWILNFVPHVSSACASDLRGPCVNGVQVHASLAQQRQQVSNLILCTFSASRHSHVTVCSMLCHPPPDPCCIMAADIAEAGQRCYGEQTPV